MEVKASQLKTEQQLDQVLSILKEGVVARPQGSGGGKGSAGKSRTSHIILKIIDVYMHMG